MAAKQKDRKHVDWLQGELPGLIEAGVLPAEAAERLRLHYGVLAPANRAGWVIFACAVAGSLLIGLGVILLLASNWDHLPRLIRTGLALAPLVAGQVLVGYVFHQRMDSAAWREGTSAFLFLSVGTAIALVSQIYQIGGDFGNFMLVWILLGLPLVYLMGSSICAGLYLIGAAVWAINAQGSNDWAQPYWLLAVLALPHLAGLLRREPLALRTVNLLWLFLLSVLLSLGFTFERLMPGLWIVAYGSLLGIYYIAGMSWHGAGRTFWQRPAQTIGFWGIAILSVILSFEWPWKEIGWHSVRYGDSRFSTWAGAVDYGVTLALLVAAIVLLVRQGAARRAYALILSTFPLLAAFAYVVSGFGENLWFSQVLFNAYLLVLSIATIREGARQDRLGTLNAGMLVLAALIAARFLDAEAGFMLRGVGFILVGAGFLAANLYLLRRKRAGNADFALGSAEGRNPNALPERHEAGAKEGEQ